MAINSVFKERHKKIHLVGIGGIGMSGIARVLLESGFSVSGSDIADGLEIENLTRLGAQVFIGHHRDHVGNADILVYSSAVSLDNPELKQAEKNNIPILPRALMLAELMRLRCGIAISGAHGKTTTTSLIGTLMHKVGLDPTVVIGGIVNHFGTNAVVGHGQFLVTEADESDGTFLHLSPTIAVVTNIDVEHLDYFVGGIEEIKEKFSIFLNALPFYGLAVICLDDPHIKDIIPRINRRMTTYGFDENAMYRAVNVTTGHFSTTFDLVIKGNLIGPCTIKMVGHYNVQNVLAAIATLEELGIGAHSLIDILNGFNGVKRRFSPVTANGFLVIDDYAHHPTEIKAVLAAAKTSFTQQKIRVLFQPHRFSRTKDLLEEFAFAFLHCDSLVVTEIYAASEKPIEGINAKLLIDKIQPQFSSPILYAKDLDEGSRAIVALTDKNDVIMTLGAGSITYAGPMIVDLLVKRYGGNTYHV